MVDMAESDSANTIICGRGRLVRRIFLTKRSFRIPAGNHGFFSPSVKKSKEFLIFAKKENRFYRFSFSQMLQLQLHVSVLHPAELAHQKVE